MMERFREEIQGLLKNEEWTDQDREVMTRLAAAVDREEALEIIAQDAMAFLDEVDTPDQHSDLAGYLDEFTRQYTHSVITATEQMRDHFLAAALTGDHNEIVGTLLALIRVCATHAWNYARKEAQDTQEEVCDIEFRQHVMQNIEAFLALCEKAEYTDTDAVHDLLRDFLERAKGLH